MKDVFKDYHPLVSFLYFTLVIAVAVMIRHPLAQAVCLLCGLIYNIQCEGRKATLFSLKLCLPVLLLTAFLNPAFSHEGVTILTYLPSGNPLTLESILYGLSSGLMMAAVLVWFFGFNRVITSDKFIYLFGRIIPALSLVLSMTQRFVPKFKAQMAAVTDAQRSIGRDVSTGSVWQRMKAGVTVLSIMVTWALENAIETADSMKSRGYGLPGRTAFSIYRFDDRDKMALLWMGFCALFLVSGAMVTAFGFRYYPSIRYQTLDAVTLSFHLVLFLLCGTPVFLNVLENRKWKAIRSAM